MTLPLSLLSAEVVTPFDICDDTDGDGVVVMAVCAAGNETDAFRFSVSDTVSTAVDELTPTVDIVVGGVVSSATVVSASFGVVFAIRAASEAVRLMIDCSNWVSCTKKFPLGRTSARRRRI